MGTSRICCAPINYIFAIKMSVLVTGGACFIGSNFVLDWLDHYEEPIINLDKLTYAGRLGNLTSLQDDKRHLFAHGDITDRALLSRLLTTYRPRAVLHFAAESHVDRSIHGPKAFIQTNVIGTFRLLESTRDYWRTLSRPEQAAFRFLHVSTDEVYGTLSTYEPPFSETHSYKRNSPYSASKAASDHLARAWHQADGLPVLTTNCSNNYGPYQFPEKLIPLTIVKAIEGKSLPIHGDGQQIRDWLYVRDHWSAIRKVLGCGQLGETYNIGGWNEKPNIEIVQTICTTLDKLRHKADGSSYSKQIMFVPDRPGHDRRYAIDASKIHTELGWRPAETFERGLRNTITWYLENKEWIQ